MKKFELEIEILNCSNCIASCSESCEIDEKIWFVKKSKDEITLECFCSLECKKSFKKFNKTEI